MSTPAKSQRKKTDQVPDQFSFLFQNHPLPMWIYDLETLRFLEVNGAAVKHYGYSRAEFPRMRISDIRPKDDAARLKAHVQTKRPRLQDSGEWRHLKKDGTIIYVDIISHKLIYKGHKAALIVANDITEYKQTRSALKESQAEFSDVIATAMDAIIIIDDRQRIVVFNPAAEKMFQRSAAEVIGEPLSLVIPHRFRKPHQGYVTEFGRSGATKRSTAHLGQFVGLRADGSEFPIEISISSVESSGQKRYAAIARDISERVRAEESLRESAERLRSLYQITSKLAAQSDVSSLLKMISDDVAALLDVPGGAVYLHDTQRAELEAVATTDLNAPVGTRMQFGEGIIGRIAQSCQPMIIDDYKISDGASSRYGNQLFYSVLGVPMLYGGELIGVLVAHGLHATSSTKERNHKFTEQDVRLLSLFASAAAGAVYSARLLELERKRRQEAETLQKATVALTSSLNLEQILNSLLDGLAQIVPFTSSAVLIDEGDQVRVVAGRGFADSEKAIGRLFPRKTSLIDEIIRIHRPLIKKDVQANPDFSNWTSQVIRGWMGVPLIVRDKPIGYLTLDSDKPGFYNETHAQIAMAFANQAAAALENARLFQNSMQSTRRWATLHAASQELARISENLEQVYASIHNAASKLFSIEVFTIALLDDKRTSIDAVYLYDRGERSPAMNVPLGKGFSGRVIESGISIKVDDDLENHPVEVDSVTFGSLEMARSILAVPLRVSDQIIGAMSIQSYEPHLYSSEDRLLLELLATQAAIAIENARLLEETSRRAQEFKALVETTRDISTQQNNESLLQMIVERATELLHSSVGGFYFYDAEHEELVSTFSTSTILHIGIRLKLGEGAMGRVALTREPILVDDYQNWEGRPPRFENIPFRAVLGVPVLFGGELMGVLEVREYGESKRTFTQNDANLLSLFAAHVGSVLHNARLFDRLEERIEQFSTLHSIDLVIGSTTDLRVSLQVVLESIVHLLKVDAASILFYNPGTLSLEYVGGVGFHLDLNHTAVRLGDGLAGRAALTRQILDVPELSKAELPAPFRQMIEHEGFISYRGLPLIAKGDVKGVLELYHRSAFPSSPEWNDLLYLLASQAAIAMDNAMLFNDLEHSNTELELAYDATIEGWAQALELRDHATGGHTRRILETTITLAYKMGIPDSELPNIRRGVLLHDIGKMGIPDQILLKPSPLSEEEWETMRQHPLNAYHLLSKISYLRSALDIPYCHHEKWDGSGYPRGLKGEQIPLSARMFSVVDVYDALSYDRPYRSAWPKEKIIEYIKEQSGKYFDPRVVEAFLEII